MSKKPAAKSLTISVAASVLGVDANFDAATLAAYQYREAHVYPYLAAQGYAVVKRQGALARRIDVAPEAVKTGVVYLTGVGHGSATTFTGHIYDPVFQVGSYAAIEADGKIVHFLSCKTAQTLGPDFVLSGCLAYFGYNEDFIFDDVEQDLFFECDSEIDRAFADGLTAADVYLRVQKLFAQRAADLRAQGKQPEAAMLESDFDRLRCPTAPPAPNAFGDPAAKLP